MTTAPLVLDCSDANIQDHQAHAVCMLIRNEITDLDRKYVVNLCMNKISHNAFTVLQILLLDHVQIDYVCVVGSPIASGAIRRYINSLNDSELKKLIWLRHGEVKQQIWRLFLENDEHKTKLVEQTHLYFYAKYKHLTTYKSRCKQNTQTMKSLREEALKLSEYTYYYCSTCYKADVEKEKIKKHIEEERIKTDEIDNKHSWALCASFSSSSNFSSKWNILREIAQRNTPDVKTNVGGIDSRTLRDISKDIYIELQKKYFESLHLEKQADMLTAMFNELTVSDEYDENVFIKDC
jgi:hypothetical protein